MKEQAYPCPSCGFIVFDEPAGSYDICPVCGWEDDHVQLKHPAMRGGANGGSLMDYQQDILKEIPFEVQKHNGYTRCFKWRPLNESDLEESDSVPQTGLDYFHSALENSSLYYWERN